MNSDLKHIVYFSLEMFDLQSSILTATKLSRHLLPLDFCYVLVNTALFCFMLEHSSGKSVNPANILAEIKCVGPFTVQIKL